MSSSGGGRHAVRLLLRAVLRPQQQRRAFASAPDARYRDTFYHGDLSVRLATAGERQPVPDASDKLVFGANFSSHMFQVQWHEDEGWGRPEIVPLHALSLHPGAKVLHYATALFEGMKAYRGVDGRIRLFRPGENMRRMRSTAVRAALPPFDCGELQRCIVELVRVDADSVPHSTDASLYIRPTFIGTDPTLGVSYSRSALLYVVSGPAGPYFPTGLKPVQLYAEAANVRAPRGGVGHYKMACNYAPTILIAKEAAKRGCQQVLWLYDDDEKLTEVGTMNIFNYLVNEHGERELVTPPLDDGIILPGVTRASLLELARKWGGFKVSERYLTMRELETAVDEGRMLEMFGSGTACIVCPVDRVLHVHTDGSERTLYIPTMEHKDGLMKRMYDAITGIQYGRIAKPDWMVDVDV